MNTGRGRASDRKHETPADESPSGFPRAMFGPMNRVVLSLSILASLIGSAAAQPTTSPSQTEPAKPAQAKPATPAPAPAPAPAPVAAKAGPATLPAVGQAFALSGTGTFPKLDWLYDVPSANDATGKVIVHWFCAPKIQGCADDLARLVTLKENGRVYIVAYINGGKPDAKKLDPIRESEGVGRGTVAYGRNMPKLMKDLKLTGPVSIVVDVDSRIQLITTSGLPADLDLRDAKVNELVKSIREYVATTDGPKQVLKPGQGFTLSYTVKLAGWLKYSDKTPRGLKLTAPADIKCDSMELKPEQLKIEGQVLTASVSCSGGKAGSYEVGGELRFGYDAPGGGTGIGAEATRWKFEIKP